MRIVHVVPWPSLFVGIVQKQAGFANQMCLPYKVNGYTNRLNSFINLISAVLRDNKAVYVFHQVPHFQLLLVSLIIPKFKYSLYYWGADYYSTFLREDYFELHCLRKTFNSAESKDEQYSYNLLDYVKRFLGLIVVKRSVGIVNMTQKQYRFVKYFHYKIFKRSLLVPMIKLEPYQIDMVNGLCGYIPSSELKILISHSATPAARHSATISILREYARKWGVRLHIFGFLSYSGGSCEERLQLKKNLEKQADFAASVNFEMTFLDYSKLINVLNTIDVAVFSCLRDEGVTLLRQFVQLGGLVSFNRHSFNYDYFSDYSPERLFDHHKFLDTPPEDFLKFRKKIFSEKKGSCTYADLVKHLCIKN